MIYIIYKIKRLKIVFFYVIFIIDIIGVLMERILIEDENKYGISSSDDIAISLLKKGRKS